MLRARNALLGTKHLIKLNGVFIDTIKIVRLPDYKCRLGFNDPQFGWMFLSKNMIIEACDLGIHYEDRKGIVDNGWKRISGEELLRILVDRDLSELKKV